MFPDQHVISSQERSTHHFSRTLRLLEQTPERSNAPTGSDLCFSRVGKIKQPKILYKSGRDVVSGRFSSDLKLYIFYIIACKAIEKIYSRSLYCQNRKRANKSEHHPNS